MEGERKHKHRSKESTGGSHSRRRTTGSGAGAQSSKDSDAAEFVAQFTSDPEVRIRAKKAANRKLTSHITVSMGYDPPRTVSTEVQTDEIIEADSTSSSQFGGSDMDTHQRNITAGGRHRDKYRKAKSMGAEVSESSYSYSEDNMTRLTGSNQPPGPTVLSEKEREERFHQLAKEEPFRRSFGRASKLVQRMLGAERLIPPDYVLNEGSEEEGVKNKVEMAPSVDDERYKFGATYSDEQLPTNTSCRCISINTSENLYAAAFTQLQSRSPKSPIAIWSVALEKEAERILWAPSPVTSLCISGAPIISAGLSTGLMCQWDLRRPDLLPVAISSNELDTRNEGIANVIGQPIVELTAMKCFSDAPGLTCVYSSGVVGTWNLNVTSTTLDVKSLGETTCNVLSAAFRPSSGPSMGSSSSQKASALAMGTDAGHVFFPFILDSTSLQISLLKRPQMPGPVSSLIFPNSSYLLAATTTGALHTFKIPPVNISTSVPEKPSARHVIPNGINALAATPNGKYIAATGGDGKCTIMMMRDLETPHITGKVQPYTQIGGCCQTGRGLKWIDDRTLLVGKQDGTLCTIRLNVGKN